MNGVVAVQPRQRNRWRRCPLRRMQHMGRTPRPVAPRTASDLDSRLVCCPPGRVPTVGV